MLGEEFGRTGHEPPRCWIIDPIDGTKNYVRGVPVWATLIGLMADGEVTVGVVSAPALGRRWWAARDGGAWTGRVADQGRRLPGLGGHQARRRLAVLLRPVDLGDRRARSMRSSAWPGRSGGPGPTAISGRTCWSPRARSTSRPRPRYRSGTWPRCRSSSPRPAASFTDLDGTPTPDGGNVRVHQRPAARRGPRRAGSPLPLPELRARRDPGSSFGAARAELPGQPDHKPARALARRHSMLEQIARSQVPR